ncbi:Serine protease, subtilisin family [Pseudomonas sp. NFACC02]|uniref:S8 family peptidase n=1 Tax=Pseudomonas sp. NFACC02 TaxID=1566250 RepID=UPI0008B58D8E|nr:S8 family serine peptidase [Pseudomonas sp. NFACC02]SER57321.1 Serine protease, subtilisin family [Pseudomonas sp. NFACC02]
MWIFAKSAIFMGLAVFHLNTLAAEPEEHRPETTRVIVKLKQSSSPESYNLGALSNPLGYMKSKYARQSFGEIQTLGLPDLIVAEMSAEGVESLRKDSNVIAVVEDYLSKPSWTFTDSASGLTTIGEVDGKNDSWEGKGETIAIVDTGINASHPFLQGKLVGEACFSSISSSSPKSKSLCPNGLETQIMKGAGKDCSSSTIGCGHGTHVAGIAVGGPVTFKGEVLQGTAPGSKFISVQVYSQFDDPSLCGGNSTPCVLSFASDQIRALNYLYTIHKETGLAVVNMSMGHGAFSKSCADDILSESIQKLVSGNVAVVAASGNEGLLGASSSPACIPGVISVGAVDVFNHLAYSYSNTAVTTTLLALGDNVLSSDQGGGYGRKTGTSMAAPQVSGALVLLRSKLPSAKVPDLVKVLKASGTQVIDGRTGQKFTALNIVSLEKFPVGTVEPAQHNDGDPQSTVVNSLPSRVVVIPQENVSVAPTDHVAAELETVTGKTTEVKDRDGFYIIEMKGGVNEKDKAAIQHVFGEKSKIAIDALSFPNN